MWAPGLPSSHSGRKPCGLTIDYGSNQRNTLQQSGLLVQSQSFIGPTRLFCLAKSPLLLLLNSMFLGQIVFWVVQSCVFSCFVSCFSQFSLIHNMSLCFSYDFPIISLLPCVQSIFCCFQSPIPIFFMVPKKNPWHLHPAALG